MLHGKRREIIYLENYSPVTRKTKLDHRPGESRLVIARCLTNHRSRLHIRQKYRFRNTNDSHDGRTESSHSSSHSVTSLVLR